MSNFYKKMFFIFVLFFFAFDSDLKAKDSQPLSFQLPDHFETKICPTPLWKNFSVIWKGVSDQRSTPLLGEESLREKKTTAVTSTLPLDQVLEQSLKPLLIQCGMTLQTQEAQNAPHLSVKIIEFYADVEKKWMTGKGIAKSNLEFQLDQPSHKTKLNLRSAIEFKKSRKKNMKQIEETLNELLFATLKQVPTLQWQ